jgi:hypothetical protein
MGAEECSPPSLSKKQEPRLTSIAPTGECRPEVEAAVEDDKDAKGGCRGQDHGGGEAEAQVPDERAEDEEPHQRPTHDARRQEAPPLVVR